MASLSDYLSNISRALGFEKRSESYGLTNINGGLELAKMLGVDSINANVSANTAMGVSTFYACVDFISDMLAAQPLGVYRSVAGGSKTAKNLNLNYLLQVRPNRSMSAFVARKAIVANYLVYGNGLAIVKRDQLGNPTEITPVPTSKVTIIEDPITGYLFYEVTGTTTKIYSDDDIIHIKDITFDGKKGKSIVSTQFETLKLSLLVKKFSSEYYQNGTFMAGFLTTQLDPKNADAAKIYKERIIESLQGSGQNGFGFAVLGSGVEWHGVTRSPVESQIIEFANRGDKEIAKFFRLAPSILGDTEKQTSFGTGVEQAFISVTNSVLIPKAIQIEQEINYKCLTFKQQRAGYYTKHNFKNLLKGDAAAYSEYVTKMIQNGVYTQDEVRAFDEMSAIPNGDGNRHWIQQNMMPLDQATDILNNQKNGKGKKVPTPTDQ